MDLLEQCTVTGRLRPGTLRLGGQVQERVGGIGGLAGGAGEDGMGQRDGVDDGGSDLPGPGNGEQNACERQRTSLGSGGEMYR